jgi:hypothetical protein
MRATLVTLIAALSMTVAVAVASGASASVVPCAIDENGNCIGGWPNCSPDRPDMDCLLNDDYGWTGSTRSDFLNYGTGERCYDFRTGRHGSWSWWSVYYNLTACVANGRVRITSAYPSYESDLPAYLSWQYSLDAGVNWHSLGGQGSDAAYGYIVFDVRFCSWAKFGCGNAIHPWIEVYVDAYGGNVCLSDRTYIYNCRS